MRRLVPLLLLPVALTACGHHASKPNTTLPIRTGTQPPPPTTSSSTTAPEPTVPVTPTRLTLYFLRDGKLAAVSRTIRATSEVAAAALAQLGEGPTGEERAAGLSSAVPHGIHPSVSIANGLATIEPMQFSEPTIAQFVYTLTEFPTVHAVEIGTGGKHFTRASLARYLPAILFDSPVAGQTVTSPLHVSGTANTFEGSFQVELSAGGRLLSKHTVQASSGSGTRGSFDASFPFRIRQAARGIVIAYTSSPATGKRADVVRIPVRVEP